VRPLALCILFVLLPLPAQAERLVSTLSNPDIEISSSFNGETLTLFGNIEPDADAEQKYVEGPFHVIVVVEGPLSDRVARQVTNRFGIWSNTDQVVFEQFPSYFHVLASDTLTDITNAVTLTVENILPEAQARQSATAGWWKSAVFGRELVRLMTEKGFFGVEDQGVRFLSDTSYKASVTLPSDIANGPFIARTYVFKDGVVVARDSQGFSVRKTGFERFLFIAASTQPLLYGLTCVLLAVGTGWLGGLIFKR
jgi:uncharacterized protein (TIGR02186 family)